MKKIIICFIFFSITIIFALSFYFINKNQTNNNYIEMDKWYNTEEKEKVVEWNPSKISFSVPYSWVVYIKEYDVKLIETIKQEKTYLGEYSIYADGVLRNSQLFFKDNCYYMGYSIDTAYCLRSLIGELIYENLDISFPFPRAMWIDLNIFSKFPLDFDAFFQTTTFEESKTFYSIFTDYITIQEETKYIVVMGNDIKTQNKYELILDFINKTISINMEGEVKTIYTYIENRFEN